MMRYVVRYLGDGKHGVIDTMAPLSVVEDQPHGHVLLCTNNGSQPAQITADALNTVFGDTVNNKPVDNDGMASKSPSFQFNSEGKGKYAGPFHGLGPQFD